MAVLARSLLILALAISVGACTRAKEKEASNADKYDPNDGISLAKLVGTAKNPPDEFAVMTSKPLVMPKSFAALPAPNPGQRSPLTSDPVAEARTVLLGDVTPQAANARTSVSEAALLSATGTATPPSDLRAVLEAEQKVAESGSEEYLLYEYFPSLGKGGNLKDAIKPEEERVRLSTLSSAQRPSGIATIPSVPSAPVPQTIQAIQSAPASPALPAVDPVSGTELIYIPE